MIKLNLLPEESYFERDRKAAKRRSMKIAIFNFTLIGVVLIGVVWAFIWNNNRVMEAQWIEQQTRIARQAMEERAAIQKAEDRTRMLNELSGKNFTTEQWALLSESERAALISAK